MTTIAVRAGKGGRIVADTLVSGDGGAIRLKRQSKLRHWPGTSIVFGLAGCASDLQALQRCPAPMSCSETDVSVWAHTVAAACASFWERSAVILLDVQSGECAAVEDCFVTVVDDSYAIGSGGAYAIGALAHGATPEQAVRIAARYDTGTCGRRLHTFRVRG